MPASLPRSFSYTLLYRNFALLLGIQIVQGGDSRLNGFIPLIAILVVDFVVIRKIGPADLHFPLLILRLEYRVDMKQFMIEEHFTRIVLQHIPQFTGELDQVVIP